MALDYEDYSSFLRRHFPYKVQKITLNAGFTCPNRDGSVGHGGCTYCNNQSFNPDYCEPTESVTQQLQKGIAFFSRKYPEMRYIAYFQAYTNTYGEIEHLKALYEEALRVEGVEGLIIGTRPDCMPDALLDYLEELSRRYFVVIEYGVESTLDRTLEMINRGHSYECSKEAILRTSQRGILVGAHLILGLPGESREEILTHADRMGELPITTLKLHQLQLIRHTAMARQFELHPEQFHLFEVDEYIDLCVEFLQRLPRSVVIERFISQSPEQLLIAPRWGLKNYEFTNRLNAAIRRMNSARS